ncbi:CheR family methyltransferase [Methylomonas sp. MgM2]
MNSSTLPINIKAVTFSTDKKPMITNSETYFFRDHGQFDLLRQRLLPELIERQSKNKTLRLWSAGCASGEEAYSLAISIDLLLPRREDWSILILGSDLSSVALAKAKRASYRPWSFRQMPAGLKQRYFSSKGGAWQLDDRIRRMVDFRCFDLRDALFPCGELLDMDLILCRNVFIYFDAETVCLVANKLAATLNEGGYLMTAHAELTGVTMSNMQSRLFSASVVHQRHSPSPAETPIVIADTQPPAPLSSAVKMPAAFPPNAAAPAEPDVDALLTKARSFADKGMYDQAEQICRDVLAAAPLMAAPHFLMAQLAQLRSDFQKATEFLEKTLYLEPDNAGALLELAALYERAKDLSRAKGLRCTALNIIRKLPSETLIEPYEMTAAEIAQRLSESTSA